MNLSKSKFFVSVLILATAIYLLSAPTAQASDFLGTVISLVVTVAAVVIIAVNPGLIGLTPVLLAEVGGGMTSYIAIGGEWILASTLATVVGVTGAMVTATVACIEGLICPGGEGGLLLIPISENACAYQIPMTFYVPRMNASYGYPAFIYSYMSFEGGFPTTVSGAVDNKALFKNQNCTNEVTDPYSSDNKYTKLANGSCVGIYPSNVFKYLASPPGVPCYFINCPEPNWVGIGFSPHYRDSACANLLSDPFSVEAKYAKVSGVGCVSIAPSGGTVLLDPYFNETDRQVAIYRYTLPANSDEAALNNWFLYTIKANVGNGWQSSYVFTISKQEQKNEQYLTSSNATPLITASYADLCAGNVCKFTDATVPENSYVAYAAKVLGSYTYIYQDTNSPYPITAKDNKFLNKDNSSYSVFPLIVPGWTVGNAINGPYKTGVINPVDCPATTPPPTVDIKANNSDGPISIAYNTAATLSWTSTNATGCTASNGWSGLKATSGSESTGNLTSSKTYTLTCTGPGGSADNSVTVNVGAPPPGNFSLNLGGGGASCNSVPLSWTASSGAEGYKILKGAARVDISPYQPYTAQNFTDTTVSQNTTYQYQIEAYNAAGTNRSNVLNVTTPYCPPTVDIKANGSDGPISIYQGQSVTLSWSSTYSTSMMGSMMGDISKELSASVSSLFSAASGGWGGSMLLNGSKVVVPLPPSATFTLTSSGPGGSASDSVTINITPLALPNWREVIPR